MYILVTQIENTKAKLELFDNQNKLILKTIAFVGQNGMTNNKKEGDKKTPVGTFELGVMFGTHKKEIFNCNYIQINPNLYWVDDVKSKYYNKLVDISKVEKDWNSAEHLIKYKEEYEYAIEIKINPKNIKEKGSATFLHCSTNRPTAGCISIDRKYMKRIFSLIDENTKIIVRAKLNESCFEVN